MAESLEGDAAGERWRLWIRYGSIAVIVATVVPSLDGQIMWVHVPTLLSYAWGRSTPPVVSHLKRALLVVFGTYTWTILLIGWVGLWITRRAGRVFGGSLRPTRTTWAFAWLIWLVTWIAPYFSSLRYLRSQSFYSYDRFVWPSSAYHLVIGSCVLWGVRRYRGTPAAVLSLLLVPSLATLVGWSCVSFLFLPEARPGPYPFTHQCLLGLGGALVSFVGTTGAWIALKVSPRTTAVLGSESTW